MQSQRHAWIDNLRTAMVVLVVNMHACVTYSHVGDWYLNETPEPAMPVKVFFLYWQGHLQAFFMGLLFFLAGVFAHRSIERRGVGAFVRERLFRLGMPALLYMGVIHPLMVFVVLGYPRIENRPSLAALYANYITSGRVLHGSGPLWFVIALLAFSLVLAGCRALRRFKRLDPRAADGGGSNSVPGLGAVLLFTMLLVMATFGMRLVQPIGTDISNFQLCFFPQYIAAFAVGVCAGRGGWMEALAQHRVARTARWLGIIGGPLILTLVVALGGPLGDEGIGLYAGGFNGQAFGLALWEQTAGVALGLGSLNAFSSYLNQDTPLSRWLADRSFTVYVIHAPVLVLLTPALRVLGTDPFLRSTVLTALGLAVSYAVADFIKRLLGRWNPGRI